MQAHQFFIPNYDLFMQACCVWSHCFRSEAGSSGAASRGLYRVHQFSKVELFALSMCENGEESEQLLQDIVEFQTEILDELGLCYR